MIREPVTDELDVAEGERAQGRGQRQRDGLGEVGADQLVGARASGR